MRIVRNSLDEKFVGYMKNQPGYDNAEIKMIMNPTTVEGMVPYVRAVSNRNGDIFYANTKNENVIHSDIIIWMIANNYLSGVLSHYQSFVGYNDIVCWQRDGRSDDMFLSEGYEMDGMPEEEYYEIEDLCLQIDQKDIHYNLELIDN